VSVVARDLRRGWRRNDRRSFLVLVVGDRAAEVLEGIAGLGKSELRLMVPFPIGVVLLTRLLISPRNNLLDKFIERWHARFLCPAVLATLHLGVDCDRDEQLIADREILKHTVR
jgi:hypothetical protein